MILYDKPVRAEPPQGWRRDAIVLQPIVDLLAADPGEWYAIGESETHNGLGTLKNRLGALVPGIELVGRKEPNSTTVVLYARAPVLS